MGRKGITAIVPLVLALGLLAAGCGIYGGEPAQAPELISPPQTTPELETPPQTGLPAEKFQAIVVRDWAELDWEQKEYPGIEEFLRDQGFDGVEPFYSYQDQEGVLQLALYYSENTGTGCGVRYIHSDGADVKLEGFAFEKTAAATGESVFSAARWDRWKAGYPALPVWEGGEVQDYMETCVEDENGRVTAFESSGIFEGYGTEDRLWIYSAQYDYDENGVLRQRHLGQNPQLFATNDSSWDSYFDAQGRVCYERGYLTHGSQEYYYIYKGDEAAPAWCLYLDEDCGVWGPTFAVY